MVVSVAGYANDAAILEAVVLSDRIRELTMKKCRSHPGYATKKLKWKNAYYDYFKKKAAQELC